ncbi:MAG TPA: hypothetical protein VGF67_34030 [Ktedonobacteraceae bacterium]|jgi:hypothetical protein
MRPNSIIKRVKVNPLPTDPRPRDAAVGYPGLLPGAGAQNTPAVSSPTPAKAADAHRPALMARLRAR